MTNPNDILDAYDELVRLVDILGTDTVRQLVDRATQRQAVAPAASSPIGKVVNFAFDTDGVTIDSTLNPDHPLTDHIRKIAKATGRQAVINAGGCPWCGLDIGKNTMFRHLNNAHRDDLEQLYVDEGTKGLQTVFGIPYQTAYGWASKLDGEAA